MEDLSGGSCVLDESVPIGVLKERCKSERFRILVIGRANAGKTTILERVCNIDEVKFDGNKGVPRWRRLIGRGKDSPAQNPGRDSSPVMFVS